MLTRLWRTDESRLSLLASRLILNARRNIAHSGMLKALSWYTVSASSDYCKQLRTVVVYMTSHCSRIHGMSSSQLVVYGFRRTSLGASV